MLSKKLLVNLLFIFSFAFWGIGNYVTAEISEVLGYAISSVPYLLLFAFFLLDFIHRSKYAGRRHIRVTTNRFYWLVLFFIMTAVVARFVGLTHGVPNLNPKNALAFAIMAFIPFHGFIVLHYYNANDPDFDFLDLFFKGMLVLWAVNMLGFAAGFTNSNHYIPGRVNFPFTNGIYEGGNIMLVVAIFSFYYMVSYWRKQPYYAMGYACLLLIDLALFVGVNSRLSTLLMGVIILLAITRALRAFTLWFSATWFLLPGLLGLGTLVYNILSLPVFAVVMQRINKKDLTTFNGRTYLWEAGMDWMIQDRTGLLFGNGFNGGGYLKLYQKVVKLWNVKDPWVLHSHSALIETVVDQGLIGILSFGIILYHTGKYYRNRLDDGMNYRAAYLVFFLILALLQIDTFVVAGGWGYILALALASPIVIKKISLPEKSLNKRNSKSKIDLMPQY
ncbi:MAG: O-antigen ligase family protein [Bacteroidota bacterium]